jgi:hypothetical protein
MIGKKIWLPTLEWTRVGTHRKKRYVILLSLTYWSNLNLSLLNYHLHKLNYHLSLSLLGPLHPREYYQMSAYKQPTRKKGICEANYIKWLKTKLFLKLIIFPICQKCTFFKFLCLLFPNNLFWVLKEKLLTKLRRWNLPFPMKYAW